MKKFWAILLAMMLVLSMVTVASASEVTEGDTPTATGFTITVNPKDDVDHEYQVYQIFTADVVADESGAKVLTASSGAQTPRTTLLRSRLVILCRTQFWRL